MSAETHRVINIEPLDKDFSKDAEAPCYFCGTRTVPATGEYGPDFDSKTIIVKTINIPMSECNDCGAQYYFAAALDYHMQQAIPIFEANGELEAANLLRRVIMEEKG